MMAISNETAARIFNEFAKEYPSLSELDFKFFDGTLGEAYGIQDPTHPAHSARAAYWPRSHDHQERGEIHGSLANAVDAADFRRSLAHEGIGHYGINTLTPGQKRTVLDGLIQGRTDADLSQAWKIIEKDYATASLDMQAEEVFTFIAEHVKPGTRTSPKRADAIIGRLQADPGAHLSGDEAFELVRSIAAGMQTGERRQQNFPATRQSLFREQTLLQGEPIMATANAGPAPAAQAGDTPAQKVDLEMIGARGESVAEFNADGSPKAPRATIGTKKEQAEDDAVLNRTQEQEKAPRADPSRTAVPDYIKAQFFKSGKRYYSSGNSNAAHYFEDQGHRIVANRDHPTSRTAQIAIDIAKARDWKAIEVTGTKEFRRTAWMHASQAGIEVSGYEPSERDRAELTQKIAGRQNADHRATEDAARSDDGVTDRSAQLARQQAQEAVQEAKRDADARATEPTERQRSAQVAKEAADAATVFMLSTAKMEAGKGKTFETAEAAMREFLKTDAQESPHLVLIQGDTVRTIGRTTAVDGVRSHTVATDFKELERTIKADAESLLLKAEQVVTVKRQQVADKVRVAMDETERQNRLAARLFNAEKTKAAAATQAHPKLAGPYAVLGAYNAKLKEQGLDAESRKVAVSHMRDTLARRIERGQYDSIKTEQVRFPQRDAQERTQIREQTSTETLSVA